MTHLASIAERPCGVCGKPLRWAWDDAESRRLAEAWSRLPASMRSTLLGIRPVCAKCEPDSAKATRYEDSRHFCDGQGWTHSRTYAARFWKSERRKEHRESYAQARAWDFRRTSLYLHGAVGCGKSFMARCALNKALVNGFTVADITAVEFMRCVSGSFKAKGIEWLYGPRVLLLDDIDKASWNESSLGWLWQLLDVRNGAGFRTIITANHEVKHVCEWLQERVPKNPTLPGATLERLKPFVTIHHPGDSLRTNRLDGFATVSTAGMKPLEQQFEEDEEEVPF